MLILTLWFCANQRDAQEQVRIVLDIEEERRQRIYTPPPELLDSSFARSARARLLQLLSSFAHNRRRAGKYFARRNRTDEEIQMHVISTLKMLLPPSLREKRNLPRRVYI